MKITLRPMDARDNSTDVVLSDGSDRGENVTRGPAQESISVSIGMQEAKGIRADYTKFKPRKNRAGSYSFRASIIFPTIEEARIYYLTHGMTCEAAGTIIYQVSDNGSANVVLHLGCVITQIGDMDRSGHHITTAYQLRFSSAVVVAPEAIQSTIDAFYGVT